VNLKSFAIRSLIAVIFGPMIILAAWYGSHWWLAFISLVVVLSVYEFYGLAQHKGAHGMHYLGILTAFVMVLALYYNAEWSIFPLAIFLFVAVQFFALYRKGESALLDVPTTVFAPLYYALSLGSFILIREMPARYGLNADPAGRWLVMLILAIWICDTAAYIGGSYLGRHKLMPRISPNKTIEGTVLGFIFAVLMAWLCHVWFVQGLRLQDSLIIGAIAGSLGQYGDLFESMFKRDAGVKDSSNLIPEHGGALDRFDSLTICAPVMYLYLKWFAF